MITLFQIIFRNNVQEHMNSWMSGYFTMSIVVSRLDFDKFFSERCLNHDFERKFEALCWDQFKIDSHGFRVWCLLIHDWITRWASCGDLFYLKESVTWCLYQSKVRFFIVTVSFLLMLGNNVCFKISNCRWAPCRLKVQSHGPIETGRFFWKPTSWAPCRQLQSRIMA
jgi:hypothetical protein